MELSTDQIIYWQSGPVVINATLVFTWLTMALLVVVGALITRRLAVRPPFSPRQTVLETLIAVVDNQVSEVMDRKATRYVPFIGTLFLLICASNLLIIVPGYHPPTGSLSTTAALAVVVFCAVPYYGIRARGIRGYLHEYVQPSPLMLPFHIISEFTRTLSLAVRLFGNIMSGEMIVAILLAVTPLFFPIIMQGLGLLVGVIQAYIFAILASVFIGSATSGE